MTRPARLTVGQRRPEPGDVVYSSNGSAYRIDEVLSCGDRCYTARVNGEVRVRSILFTWRYKSRVDGGQPFL